MDIILWMIMNKNLINLGLTQNIYHKIKIKLCWINSFRYEIEHKYIITNQYQYLHPVESVHTFDEVLKWFDDNDIEFISSIPEQDFNNTVNDKIFDKCDKGTIFSRIFNQIKMLFTTYGDDGGLFIFIGRKNV